MQDHDTPPAAPDFGVIRHTMHDMLPSKLRPPARPAARSLREWPRDRLIHLAVEYADRARRDGDAEFAFMLDTAADALVSLDVADFRLAGAMFELVEIREQLAAAKLTIDHERARNTTLIAQIQELRGKEFSSEPTNVAKPTVHTRPTAPLSAQKGES